MSDLDLQSAAALEGGGDDDDGNAGTGDAALVNDEVLSARVCCLWPVRAARAAPPAKG